MLNVRWFYDQVVTNETASTSRWGVLRVCITTVILAPTTSNNRTCYSYANGVESIGMSSQLCIFNFLVLIVRTLLHLLLLMTAVASL